MSQLLALAATVLFCGVMGVVVGIVAAEAFEERIETSGHGSTPIVRGAVE